MGSSSDEQLYSKKEMRQKKADYSQLVSSDMPSGRTSASPAVFRLAGLMQPNTSVRKKQTTYFFRNRKQPAQTDKGEFGFFVPATLLRTQNGEGLVLDVRL
jgi:hypothetical protein